MKHCGRLVAFMAASITLAIGAQANAGVIIDIVESDGNLEATLSGDFNLDATLGSLDDTSSNINFMSPIEGAIAFGGAPLVALYGVDVDWAPFGPGAGQANFWDEMSGDNIALFGNEVLGLPVGYESGTALNGFAIEFDETFESAGMTVGSYVTTVTNGPLLDGISDTITINIVPGPGALGLMGLFGLAAGTRRRKR